MPRGISRRRFVSSATAAAALAGCGARGQFSVADAPLSAQAQAAGRQRLFVATARRADPAPIAYGSGRARGLDFARLDISIPPTHRTGNIEWPRGTDTDPAEHFALVGAQRLSGADDLVRAVASASQRPGRETVLFVHGYNTNFAEGAYRHAQVAWDYELKGPQIHFAWPSAASATGYTYDRDSALVARDLLVDLLLRLLAEPGLNLSLVGHSMGAFLVMEALRQISLQDDASRLGALASVALISPDIDIDLFRAQAGRLDPLPQPFVVAVARNDRPLYLSQRLAGGQARLGTVEDLSELEGLGVVVIDMTGLGSTGDNHFLAGTSPAAISLIRGLRESGPPPATDITLGPVRILLGAVQ